jgi:hypothetical protein
MKSKLIKVAIIILAFALGMFINKWMSLDTHQLVAKVVASDPYAEVIQISTDKKDYDCTSLSRLEKGKFLTFCVGKKPLIEEAGKYYVAGETHVDTDTIFIKKNLDTCGIMHELGHTEGLNEAQAYDLSNLCYQLVAKGIWKN